MGHVHSSTSSTEAGEKDTVKSGKVKVQGKVFVTFLASKGQVPQVLKYFTWMGEELSDQHGLHFYRLLPGKT